MTQIKRDFLALDFKIYLNVTETLSQLKEERLKSKYSAEYHTEVLAKMF
jgi:hypothetical protein